METLSASAEARAQLLKSAFQAERPVQVLVHRVGALALDRAHELAQGRGEEFVGRVM